jgi:hypothetical protein
MSRDDDAKTVRLFDNRTIERSIRKGLITRKDYEKFLKSLPDVSEKMAPADAINLADDDDDDDDIDELDEGEETPEGAPPAA